MCLFNRKNKAFLTASELLPCLEAQLFFTSSAWAWQQLLPMIFIC